MTDRKDRKIKRSPVKLWDITILAPYSIRREALTNSALSRQRTFYKTLAQTQTLKFHCPFLPVNSNKKHVFHKGVRRETFCVYADLGSGSSGHLYGHACVCACTHTHVYTQRLPVAAQLWDPWETVISTCQINAFFQVIKAGHLVNLLFSMWACSQSAWSHTWDRLFQLGRRPAFLGEAALAGPPNTRGQPVITSPVRTLNTQSIYCTGCLGECFLFKTVFTTHRNSRRKALLQCAFCSWGLWHRERLSSMLEVTQMDIGGAGQWARPAWLRSQTKPDRRGRWLWSAPRGLSEPRQSFLTRSRLLFVAHGLENRWLLEILQVPWDLPPWNVKAAKFKPGALGARETAGIFFTRTDEVRDGMWNLWIWEWQSPLIEHHLYFRPWTPGVMEELRVNMRHRYPHPTAQVSTLSLREIEQLQPAVSDLKRQTLSPYLAEFYSMRCLWEKSRRRYFSFNFQDSFEKNIMWRMSTLEYIKMYHKDNKISMYYYKNQQIDQGSKIPLKQTNL